MVSKCGERFHSKTNAHSKLDNPGEKNKPNSREKLINSNTIDQIVPCGMMHYIEIKMKLSIQLK